MGWKLLGLAIATLKNKTKVIRLRMTFILRIINILVFEASSVVSTYDDIEALLFTL